MVALASPEVTHARRRGVRWRWSWSLAAGAALLVGVAVRLAMNPLGPGDHSAAVMMVLLGSSAWSAATVLANPRTAFLVTLGLVTLLDVAALPPRGATDYDDRQALFQSDQELAAQVPAAAVSSPALLLLVEPTFAGAQPQFGLAGVVDGSPLTWDCAFRRGMQRLVLPLPAVPPPAAGGTVDVRLRLTGSPSRETDYLLVYDSAAHGGVLISVVDATQVGEATTCTVR